nr:division/cell wall cluster transcriptional repressor MraZ [Gramella sp. AN32]
MTLLRLDVVNLIGTYECKVDAKGRLMVPAALKKQLAPMLQEGFVVKRSVFQPCLELYPMSEWNVLMNKMNALNRFKKKNNDFIRRFTAGVKTVEVDTNGRLLIPKDLTAFADINKEIVLSSAINIVEIWDKDKYENTLEASSDDFADLAEEVMGNEEMDGIS